MPGCGLGVEEGAWLVRIEILFENFAVDRLVVDNQNLAGQRIGPLHSTVLLSTFRAKSTVARQSEIERRAFAERGFDPYAALVPAHDLPANGQAHAAAGAFVPRIKTFEDAEHLLRILWLDSDSVVAHGKQPVVSTSVGGNVNAGNLARIDT